MSLTADAIEKLQESHVAIAFTEALEFGRSAVAIPQDFKVTDLEPYMPNRLRLRGTFATHLIADFCSYIAARSSSSVFINPENMQATALFNIGTVDNPGHCDDKASLKLQKTAAFKAFCERSSRMDQKTAAEWMEDWRDHISAYGSGGEKLEIAKAISAIRRIKVEASQTADHSVDDMASARSLMETVEAKSEHGLPHRLVFTCEPYHGLGEFSFQVRLGVSHSERGCTVLMQNVQMEAMSEAMADKFQDLLEERLGDNPGHTTHIGTYLP